MRVSLHNGQEHDLGFNHVRVNPSKQTNLVGSKQKDIKHMESFVKHQLQHNLPHKDVEFKGNC